MIELMNYLRARGFKTFIVSGGGIEFMRVFSEDVYGVPPEQVIGSTGALRYEISNGQPVLIKLDKVNSINDKDGKPIGIQNAIGRRPILAFGNSDGDYQMIEWTTAGTGPRLGRWCTMTMPSASSLTTASRRSAGSRKVSTTPPGADGSSSA